MSSKVYETYVFENEPEWESVPEGKLEFSNWDSKAHYNTFFRLCFVRGKGIYLRMRTDETELRREGVKRDDNIWEDSCMELFLCPFSHRQEYLNFEMNPNGAYLCQYGEGRQGRVFLSTLTDIGADVSAHISADGWSLELFVPESLVSEAFGEHFSAAAGTLRGNFYKCGDLTAKPHYDSFNKMTTLPPGFHNPECFAQIKITER